MGRGPARPIKISEDGPWLDPAHHIINFSRHGPARPIFKSLGPARHIFQICPARPGPDKRPMASPGIFATPTVAQECVTFRFLLFGGIISPRPLFAKVVALLRFSPFGRHVFALPPLTDSLAAVFLDVFPVPYG